MFANYRIRLFIAASAELVALGVDFRPPSPCPHSHLLLRLFAGVPARHVGSYSAPAEIPSKPPWFPQESPRGQPVVVAPLLWVLSLQSLEQMPRLLGLLVFSPVGFRGRLPRAFSGWFLGRFGMALQRLGAPGGEIFVVGYGALQGVQRKRPSAPQKIPRLEHPRTIASAGTLCTESGYCFLRFFFCTGIRFDARC